MQDLSLHILDIVENSITAGAKNIEIRITENLAKDLLTIEITDDGKGMDKEFAEKVADPFLTTRIERKVGLGLSLFAEAARMSNGHLTIRSEAPGGTKTKAIFQHSHIDRKPLGNPSETLMTLIVGNPEIDFLYCHTKDGMKFSLDSRELKAQLKSQSISSSEGLKVLKDKLKQDLHEFKYTSVV